MSTIAPTRKPSRIPRFTHGTARQAPVDSSRCAARTSPFSSASSNDTTASRASRGSVWLDGVADKASIRFSRSAALAAINRLALLPKRALNARSSRIWKQAGPAEGVGRWTFVPSLPAQLSPELDWPRQTLPPSIPPTDDAPRAQQQNHRPRKALLAARRAAALRSTLPRPLRLRRRPSPAVSLDRRQRERKTSPVDVE